MNTHCRIHHSATAIVDLAELHSVCISLRSLGFSAFSAVPASFPAHVVKTAKYTAIDFHGHPQGLIGSNEGLQTLGAALDSLNVRMMVSADNLSGERLQRVIAAIGGSPKMKDRVRVLAGINFRDV